jgi:hypothetical protein
MAMFRAGKDDLVAPDGGLHLPPEHALRGWGEDPISEHHGLRRGILIEPAPARCSMTAHHHDRRTGAYDGARCSRPLHDRPGGGASARARDLRRCARVLSHAADDELMTAVEASVAHKKRAGGEDLKLPVVYLLRPSSALLKFNDPQAGMRRARVPRRERRINSISARHADRQRFSLEKLVFDDEVVAHAKRFVRPVEVKDDLPAAELLAILVRDKHLLTSEHTLTRWPEELYLPGPMVDRTNWDQWTEAGSHDWRARANQVIDETLAAYETEPLPSGQHAEIREMFVKTCREQEAFTLPALAQSA